MTTNTENASVLRFHDGTLSLMEGRREAWSIDLARVALIGELTTPDGPIADDYFLVFVVGPEEWCRIPIDAVSQGVMNALAHTLGCRLEHHLANRTEFASAILWPPALQGEEFIKFEQRRRPGFLGWLTSRLGLSSVELSLDDQIVQDLFHTSE